MKWAICFYFVIGCMSIHSAEDDIRVEATIVSAVDDGNVEVVKCLDSSQPETLNNANIQEHFERLQSFPNVTHPIHKRSKRETSTLTTAVVELLVVVDKEFADVFQQNYQKIVDYLTVFFWDVNMRYKTLVSLDLSFRVTGLLVMSSKAAQPFVENSRNGNGVVEFGPLLGKFGEWMYQQRTVVAKHDMAVLITNAKTERLGGLAVPGGACYIDTPNRRDLNTVVFTDDGAFTGTTIASHEMGHNLGAPHDDEAGCPYGFIMSGDCGNEIYRYFFSKCSDARVNAFVKSPNGDCLRQIDATNTPVLDVNFSSAKAGTMDQACKSQLGPTAWLDAADTTNCKLLQCKFNGVTYPRTLVENVQCSNGGRCFRGKCRPESKMLINLYGSQPCLGTDNRIYGYQAYAKMTTCPSAKNKTPLDTIELISVPSGYMLATPFLYNENKESGNRCFTIGSRPGSTWPSIVTDRCDAKNSSQLWNVEIPQSGYTFRLVHKDTKYCAIGGVDKFVDLTPCAMIGATKWGWTDGV